MYINGYKLIGDLHNDKSGYARWGFARKNGAEVFIKEFLSPIYPVDESELSPELLERRRSICDEFESSKRRFYDALNRCVTGNIVTVLDFFRYGSKFYIATEKVASESLSIKEVSGIEDAQKLLIIKVVLYCISVLHENNIVHGDIKADNILLKKTTKGMYTAKIIDFDSGFLESEAPKAGEELQGDMVYFAPEAFLHVIGEDARLTGKIDIYALGILFHQYYCGEVPGFDTKEYDYLFEAILNDAEIKINDRIPGALREIITLMLDKDPDRRPQAKDILQYLQDMGKNEKREPAAPAAAGGGKAALKSTMRTGRPQAEVNDAGSGFFKKAGDI